VSYEVSKRFSLEHLGQIQDVQYVMEVDKFSSAKMQMLVMEQAF